MSISYPPTHILLKTSLSCTFLKTRKLSSRWFFKGRSPTVRRVSRTHRVALVWLFDQFGTEDPNQICGHQNQLADMLTIGSFARDEWNHLPRLFNFMSFSMFSCSHFSNFLSDPIGTQSAMSMRGQEATSSEGSPMTKPKPMILAKARPVNLASHSPSSERENPPQDLRDPVDPENVDEVHGQTSTRKHVQTATPRTEFQNMKYTTHQYMTKVFQFLQKKLGITAEHSTFSMEALKTNVLMWRMSCLRQWKQPFILDRIIWRIWRSTRTRISRKFTAYSISHRNCYWSILKRLWMYIRFTALLHPGRDQYCLMIKWSSGQRQKSTCRLRFRTMSGEGWMTAKMQLRRIQNVSFLHRIVGNPWRSNWIRLEYFPRISPLQILQEIQHDLKEEHWIRKGSQTESSSCQCSTTSIGQEKEIKEYAKILPRTLGVLVWNCSLYTWRTWDAAVTQMVERFKDVSHPVLKTKCFESWDPESENLSNC